MFVCGPGLEKYGCGCQAHRGRKKITGIFFAKLHSFVEDGGDSSTSLNARLLKLGCVVQRNVKAVM